MEDFRSTEANAVVLAEAETRLRDIQVNLWSLVGTELDGEDPWFYLRAYTAGLQEYVEALSFYHHLRHGGLVSWEQVSKATSSTDDVDRAPTVLVPRADYMLGVADLTGEVMRQAVNSAGFGNTKMCFQLLTFLQVGQACISSRFPKTNEPLESLPSRNIYENRHSQAFFGRFR